MNEKKEAPQREPKSKFANLPLSTMSDGTFCDSKGEILGFNKDDLMTIAKILNCIGNCGYSIAGAQHLLKLCEVALKVCTAVGTDYDV